MAALIRRDFRFMPKREPNVVQSIQQTMPYEFIDGKLRAKSLVVAHFAFLEVHRELIVVNLLRSLYQLHNLILTQLHREETVLRAVVSENVREGRRDHCTEAEVGQRPYRKIGRASCRERVLACV